MITDDFTEEDRTWLLQPVIDKLTKLEAQMAETQAQLDAAIQALSAIDTQVLTDVTAEDTGLSALIVAVNALIAKIQAGATGIDLTNEVTAVQSLTSGLTPVAADLATQTTNITAAVAAAQAVTGA